MKKTLKNKGEKFKLTTVGFTLIELLAVIVILAIISLMAIPIILNVVADAQNSADMSSAMLIINSGKNYFAGSLLDEEKKNNIENGVNIYQLIDMINKPEQGQMYINKQGQIAIAVIINNKCYKKTYMSEVEIIDLAECDLGYMGEDEINPTINQKVINTSINDKGWFNEDMYIEVEVKDDESGPLGYKRCMGINECEPNDDIYKLSDKIYISTESETNYVCVIGIDNKGNESEKNCEIYKLDKSFPMLIPKEEDIEIIEGDNNIVSNYFTVSYGISGGSISCNPANTSELNVGTQTVSCTAIGGNGKQLTATKQIIVNSNFYFENDNSGANSPALLNNMIPIVYNGTNWIYSDGIQNNWYNYENKLWANAVVLKDDINKTVGDIVYENEIALWYVWIPRYKYQLFNVGNSGVSEQAINIIFEQGTETTGTVTCFDRVSGAGIVSEECTNANIGNWYTHPAFTFGTDKLTGFWVGKFEISGSINEVTIIPGATSLLRSNISTYFSAIQNINTVYNIDGDSHMIKNMEWGAIAYLKQSKYGLETSNVQLNTNKNYYTGGGTGEAYKNNTNQSTTGNIYGVYDMHGGAGEYVMANMVTNYGSFSTAESGFYPIPDSKYYDRYTFDTYNSTYRRSKYGDAIKETIDLYSNCWGGCWEDDSSAFVFSGGPWLVRGGYYDRSSSIFSFCNSGGGWASSVSSRAILLN